MSRPGFLRGLRDARPVRICGLRDAMGKIAAMRAQGHLAHAALVLLAPLVLSRAAGAAATPIIGVQIDETRIRYSVMMPIDVFDALVDAKRKHEDHIDAEERAAAEAAAQRLFRERNPVRIDGVTVVPTLEEMAFLPSKDAATQPANAGPPPDEMPSWLPDEFADAGKTGDTGPSAGGREDAGGGDRIKIAGGTVSMVFVYETKGRPRNASIVWRLFPDPGAGPVAGTYEKMRAGLVAFGEFREVLFTREEPEFIWHALEAPGKRAVTLRVSEPASRSELSLPVLTLAMLVAMAVALVVMRRRGTNARVTACVAAPMFLIALAASRILTVDVPLPEWNALERPSDEDARRIFEALHRNIYRAFDYRTEDDIYDVLEQSADGDILDEIYTEIYTSLVMRDSGGAVCKVQSVKYLDMEIEDIVDDVHDAGFGAACHWRVMGSVTHWGHTHFRTNEYRAEYVVEPRGDSWKITGVNILQYSRIDDDNLTGGAKTSAGKPKEKNDKDQ